ncbi:MAG: hypothetical protein ABFD92_08275 [Planctomycetaceae bacterium]|nr:hypothetical protein [Planctomycetaceae bacterium]
MPTASLPEPGSSGASPWARALPAAAIAALVLAAACGGLTFVWDHDTHFHLASGKWMLDHGSVLRTDPFSVHDQDHWLNIQWLFQVVIAALHAVGGWEALSVLKSALAAGMMLAMLLALRRHVPMWWLAIACGLAMYVALSRVRVRPEPFTMLYLTVMVIALEAVRRGASARWLWLMTPVMILWVNMQGLFILGLGVFWTAMAGAAVERFLLHRPSGNLVSQESLAAALAATAGCLVSPWPVEALTQPFLLLTRISGEKFIYTYFVSELSPTWQAPLSHPAALALLGLTVLAMLINRRRTAVAHWLWLAMFGALAAMAIRNIGLLWPACAYLLAWHGGEIVRRIGTRLRPPAWTGAAAAGLVILGGLAAAAGYTTEWTLRATSSWQRFGAGRQEENFPIAQAEFLKTLPAKGDILSINFGDASAFIYHAWPQRLIWMDGRLEAHSQQRFLRYHELASNDFASVAALGASRQLPPSVRFYFVGQGDGLRLSIFAQSDRMRLLSLSPAGACFTRTDWNLGGALPPPNSNLREAFDRPMTGDGSIEGWPMARRRWYRQNPTPMMYRLGQMLMWLGRQPDRTTPLQIPPPPSDLQIHCSLLSVRFLSAAVIENLQRPAITEGMLAQALQVRALYDRVEPSGLIPADINAARGLYLYNRLPLGTLSTHDLKQFGPQRIRAMSEARQYDAAAAAVGDLLRFFPPREQVTPPEWYLTLRNSMNDALNRSRDLLEEKERLGGMSPGRAAMIMASPQYGLIDQAIAAAEAAPPGDADAARAAGDLHLRKGQTDQARAAYERAAKAIGTHAPLRLRMILCDWVEGRLWKAHQQLDALTAGDEPNEAECYYHATLLEQLGLYDQARAVALKANPHDPAVREYIERLLARITAVRASL